MSSMNGKLLIYNQIKVIIHRKVLQVKVMKRIEGIVLNSDNCRVKRKSRIINN